MKTILIKPGAEPQKESFVIEGEEDILMVGFEGGSIDLDMTLAKPGASGKIYGIIVGTKNQEYTIKTLSDHVSPNATSRVHIKGVFLDNSKMNFEGMIKIEKDAQISDAYLKNDNLLIGENAVVNSSPQLEIKADDVKASHGVTISSINENELYYLMSRGLDQKLARRFLVEGFINDILNLTHSEVNLSKVLKSI